MRSFSPPCFVGAVQDRGGAAPRLATPFALCIHDYGPQIPRKHKDPTFWFDSRLKTRRIPETMVCRILMFTGSLLRPYRPAAPADMSRVLRT